MSTIRHTDSLRENLACPQCTYSLRGLGGDAVRCPECGVVCDVARMMTRRWDRPWFEVPGYSALVLPVAIAAFTAMPAGLVWLILSGVGRPTGIRFRIVAGLAGMAAAILWLWSLRRAARRLPSQPAVLLSLLGHVVFIGYVGGLIGGIAALTRAIQSVMQQTTTGTIAAVLWLVAIVVLTALMVVCRRGERMMAERCLRAWLTAGAAPPVSLPSGPPSTMSP